MENLTVREITELLLAVIYDESRPEEYIDVAAVAEKLGIDDRIKMINLAYFLEFDGLIEFRNTPVHPSARITPKGINLVERGGTSGIIAKYRENPDSFLSGASRKTS